MKPRTRQDCSLPQGGPGSKTNSKSAQTPKLRAFLFPNPTIQLSTAHSMYPKGNFSPSRFCFSVPNVQYYVHKAQSYHIQANIPSNSRTKTSILCSKCSKTRVPNPKSAQKPRFCARKGRKRGFQTPKAHKKPDFVLEKKGIGIGNRKSGLPANHRARFQNANTS